MLRWWPVVALTKKLLVLFVGWMFILLGVVGLFLPFLQGILFIMIGLIILSKESATARRWLDHFKERHPRLFEKIGEWKGRIRARILRRNP
jgi:uncharacterized membrane protein YbaN (DUF454 family)